MIYCDFINIDITEPDFIISFGCMGENYDQDNDILIVRTPIYEGILNEEDRGAHLSLGYNSETVNVLQSVNIDEKEKIISFEGGSIKEVRNCSIIDDNTFKKMKEFFQIINFDNSFSVVTGGN
jgi:hypothetical protein